MAFLKVGLKPQNTVLGCTVLDKEPSSGVYRWLVLSLISYVLAHWAYLSTASASDTLPDWGEAAEIAFQTVFPHLVVLLLLQHIERLRELTLSQGINIQISRCKI